MRKLMLLSLTAVLLASCGSKKESEKDYPSELKPATTEISGDFEGYFEVVDKTYEVTEDFMYGMLTVEIKRIKEGNPFSDEDAMLTTFGTYTSAAHVCVGFGIEFLNENGTVVDKVNANGSGFSASYDPDEAVTIVKLKDGKTGTLRFKVGSECKDAVSFRITSAYEEVEGTSSSSSSYSASSDDDDDDDEVASSGSEDWDKVLDQYEKYTDKYIAVMKKVANGDTSAMSEYPSLYAEAEKFSNKLANAKGDMTSEQIARYTKITTKLANAAASM